jgi:formylglycine-generating enzyme required for sulfatase activity
MKQKIFSFITVALLLLAATISCRKVPVDSIKLDQVSLIIFVGETATLTPIFIPPNAHNQKVSWKSKDTDVATVDNHGNVTGKSVGQTIVKVITEDHGRTAQCLVTVIQPIEPEEMIWVEGGTFMMGSTDDECFNRELPVHEVTLSGFYMSKYAVTQKEWTAAMRSTSDHWQGSDLPAYQVNWEDAQIYIRRLNAYTGKNYRLPTEAEWEYAARGGNKSQGYKYSGGNNIDKVAWYHYNSEDRIHPVGKKWANELGIYDMCGNADEWCSDYYGYYTDVPQTNPTGPDTGNYRIFRGGHCTDPAEFCRISCRWYAPQDVPVTMGISGFRLVHP